MVAISYITNDGIYKGYKRHCDLKYSYQRKAGRGRMLIYGIKIMIFWKISSWIATDIDLKVMRAMIQGTLYPRHVMIERRLAPVFDNNGKDVAGYCSSFVDQTEKIKSFQDFKDYFTKTKNATEEIRMYADSINQILKGCGIRFILVERQNFHSESVTMQKKERNMARMYGWRCCLMTVNRKPYNSFRK